MNYLEYIKLDLEKYEKLKKYIKLLIDESDKEFDEEYKKFDKLSKDTNISTLISLSVLLEKKQYNYVF